MQKLRLLLFLFCFAGCATDQTVTRFDFSKIDSRAAVIFVPGYYGSALKAKVSGDREFITSRQVLFGKRPLNIYGEELNLPETTVLEPEGVLKSIPVIPVFYQVDVYGNFLSTLETWGKKNNRQVIPVAYDWRDDWLKAVKRIDDVVQHLQKAGVTRIDIVAHSMGGLVATYYLAYGTQEPETAVLDWRGAKVANRFVVMGTPFGGVFSVFRNMQRGAVLAGNEKLFPAETIASYPSCYQLLPYSSAKVMDRSGKTEAIAMTDFDYWNKNRLGLLKRQDVGKEALGRREAFTKSQIVRAVKFKTLIEMKSETKPAPPENFKILSLVGEGRQTVATGYFDKEKQRYFFDTDELEKAGLKLSPLFEDGDGTVTRTSAKIPQVLLPRAQVMITKRSHEQVFADETFLKAFASFLQ